MDQKIEIERMEAAFKRAADKAIHGTREERAGRYAMRDDVRSTTREDKRPSHLRLNAIRK